MIHVDWADSALADKQLILKAAVPVKGRAISIYEEVHPMRCYNNARAHRRFLHRLQSILPEGCRPIVVTDAGFRDPWFRDVEALGWDWVGRIRNRIKYLRPQTRRWCFIHSLYREATAGGRHIGVRCLSRRHRYWGRLYLLRAFRWRPGRHRKRRTRRAKYRQMHQTPWLLPTSLHHHRGAGTGIKRIYAQRMQIELIFKELKSHYRLEELPTRKAHIVETQLFEASLRCSSVAGCSRPCRNDCDAPRTKCPNSAGPRSLPPPHRPYSISSCCHRGYRR